MRTRLITTTALLCILYLFLATFSLQLVQSASVYEVKYDPTLPSCTGEVISATLTPARCVKISEGTYQITKCHNHNTEKRTFIYTDPQCKGNVTTVIDTPLNMECSDNTRELCEDAPPTGYFTSMMEVYDNCEDRNLKQQVFVSTEICIRESGKSVKYGCRADGGAEVRAWVGNRCVGLLSTLAEVFDRQCKVVDGVARATVFCRSSKTSGAATLSVELLAIVASVAGVLLML